MPSTYPDLGEEDSWYHELHKERGYPPTLHRPETASPVSSCASSELPAAVRSRYNALCAIMVANGAIINGVELAYNRIATPDGNVSVIGFRATRDFADVSSDGETLVFVPWDLTLSSAVMRRARESFLVRELVNATQLAVYEEEELYDAEQLRRLQRERQGLSNAANGSGNGTAGVAEIDVVSPAPSVPSPPPPRPKLPEKHTEFLTPLGYELFSRVSGGFAQNEQIDEETMWQAASILEAEATVDLSAPVYASETPYDDGVASGGGEKSRRSRKPLSPPPSSPPRRQMRRAEYLARMSAAEYAELPDHLPVVWYAFPAVYRRTLALWRASRRAELGKPLFTHEDEAFDLDAEALRRMHAFFVATYARHADPRVRRRVCDPRHVVRVVLQLSSRVFGADGDHFGRIAAPVVDLFNHRSPTNAHGPNNANYEQRADGFRIFTSPRHGANPIAKGDDVTIVYSQGAPAQFLRLWGFVAHAMDDPGCDDAEDAATCAAWKAQGECEGNPGYMRHWCMRACGVCESAEVRARIKRIPSARRAARRLAAAQRMARRETREWERRSPDAFAGWMACSHCTADSGGGGGGGAGGGGGGGGGGDATTGGARWCMGDRVSLAATMTRRRSISNGNLLQLHPSASAATRGGGGGGSGSGSSVEDDGEGQRVGSVGSVGDADPLVTLSQQLQCHTVSDGCPLSGVDVWHSTAGTRVYL